MSQNEAFSRVVIDRKLRESGWNIENEHEVIFEDHGSAGRSDYVLKDSNGRAIALVEAKRPDTDPYTAKKQTHDYIKLQYPNITYIYLANDHIVYFWDLDHGDATPVPAFFSQEDLERRKSASAVRQTEFLSQKAVSEDYFSDVSDGIKIRPYQLKAWRAIAHNFDEGNRSFLLEMATGAGKTVLASLIISKVLRSNNAYNVLFIVDRKSLAIQTRRTFEQLLGNISAVGTYWGNNKKNLVGSNVVVATIQSLSLHGKRDFSPGYFDLIIHDEAHRSIYAPEARAVIGHFIGATKIGLTATPKDFLKNIDTSKLGYEDPRALEKRIQRDTYRYFDCEDGKATYRYTIQDGVKDGFLVEPKYHKMNTVLTQSSLSEEGLRQLDDIELEEGTTLRVTDLERKIYLPERNVAMMEEFLHYAEKTPAGEIAKTIIFAVSQKHARDLEKILNKLKPEYNGRFAATITSAVPGAHDIAKDFSRDTSQLPRIAVTVDMLSTGFDAPEVMNLVLCRPIGDPTTYQQVKGRGTRLCPEIDKDHFTIFDFCGVVAYFDEKYDWEAPLKVTETKITGTIPNNDKSTTITDSTPETPQRTTAETPTSYTQDVVSSRDQIAYGPDGDTVDRNMYQDEWTKSVRQFMQRHKEHIEDVIDSPDRSEELIERINVELLDKPDYYFNEENLQKSLRIVAGVKDFFLSAIGRQALPSREEQLAELKQGLLNKFGSKTSQPSQQRSLMIESLAESLMNDTETLQGLRTEPNLQFLAKQSYQRPFSARELVNEFGKDSLLELATDVAESKIMKV